MNDLPVAHAVLASAGDAVDTVTLGYEARFLRRRRLVTDGGLPFMVDLARATSLEAGAALVLQDGRAIAVRAAREPLLEVTGGDLARIAWHIGNRHTPCQIEPSRLLIRRDPIMRDMLERIGARLRDVSEPFTPEGGAYGHGRTHAHDHGPAHRSAPGSEHRHHHGDGEQRDDQ